MLFAYDFFHDTLTRLTVTTEYIKFSKRNSQRKAKSRNSKSTGNPNQASGQSCLVHCLSESNTSSAMTVTSDGVVWTVAGVVYSVCPHRSPHSALKDELVSET